jgi:hypothetical protein
MKFPRDQPVLPEFSREFARGRVPRAKMER